MPSQNVHARSFQDVQDFVYKTLCEHEQLEIGVFPMTEKVLRKKQTPCGVYFCLHGPRSVKFTAIWESENNRVLFYGSDGERFHNQNILTTKKIEIRG